MSTRLIALIAVACMSTAAVAQSTDPQSQTSGTSNTGTPTKGQSNANSGEQNATAMQNNSNAQNNPQGKTAKDRKAHKNSKNKADCNDAHTDGHATTPATARADCDNTTKVQR